MILSAWNLLCCNPVPTWQLRIKEERKRLGKLNQEAGCIPERGWFDKIWLPSFWEFLLWKKAWQNKTCQSLDEKYWMVRRKGWMMNHHVIILLFESPFMESFFVHSVWGKVSLIYPADSITLQIYGFNLLSRWFKSIQLYPWYLYTHIYLPAKQPDCHLFKCWLSGTHGTDGCDKPKKGEECTGAGRRNFRSRRVNEMQSCAI